MSQAAKKSLVQIPKEIPKDLFVSISSEEYCSQLLQKRLAARRAKYGPDATPLHEMGPDPMALLASAAEREKGGGSAPMSFPPPEKTSGLFTDPARGAASIVALLVVGIACYSTYFGA